MSEKEAPSDLLPQQVLISVHAVLASKNKDDLLGALQMLSGAAPAAMQQQNVQLCNEMVDVAGGIMKKLQGQIDKEEAALAQVTISQISMMAGLARATKAQLECAFDYGRAQCQKARVHCRSGIDGISLLHGTELGDALENAGLTQLFQIMDLVFEVLEDSMGAELLMLRGQVEDYFASVREIVAKLGAVEKFDVTSPMVAALNQMLRGIAYSLGARIRFLEADISGEARYQKPTGRKVLIIHGHDEVNWKDLRDLLKEEFDLEAKVLLKEANDGRTLIQKFEEIAGECSYAFAMVTPDDFVKKGKTSYFQPRPNVIFEFGWFYGHFGPKRACILKKGDTVLPSDLGGILSVDFGKNVNEAVLKIRDELETAGVIKGNKTKPARRKKLSKTAG